MCNRLPDRLEITCSIHLQLRSESLSELKVKQFEFQLERAGWLYTWTLKCAFKGYTCNFRSTAACYPCPWTQKTSRGYRETSFVLLRATWSQSALLLLLFLEHKVPHAEFQQYSTGSRLSSGVQPSSDRTASTLHLDLQCSSDFEDVGLNMPIHVA